MEKSTELFLTRTGWKPTVSAPVAGALRYSEYNFLIRLVMRGICRAEGLDTDTSRDYEYTDWPALDEIVDGFLAEHAVKWTRRAL